MNLLTTILIIELILIFMFFLLIGNQYKAFVKKNMYDFQLTFMAPISLYLIDRLQIIERISRIQNIHQKMIKIYGARNGLAATKMFLAQIISAIFLFTIIFTFFASALNNINWLFFSLPIILILPIGMIKDLDKKLKKRQQKILIELPELLNKIVLLVNAGETLQKAIIHSVEQKKEIDKSPLYVELIQVVNELKLNHPFSKVMEEFSKRIGVQEVSIFVTTILLNYKRGGSELIVALRDLAKNLWEKRKLLARTLGEEASSKLVFPMVIIFFVVMIVVAFPAIKLMG